MTRQTLPLRELEISVEIKRVHALVFSGAGTTTAVARRFCESFAKASNQLGMPVEVEVDDITPAASAVPAIGANELVVVAVPSYGGRVPTPVASRLSKLGHVGAPAIMLVTYGNRAVDDTAPELPQEIVLLVTYGNRAVDDTFIELADTLESKGMVPVSGAAVVAHHSLMTNVAQGRPDQDDLSVVDELARHASSKLAHAACARDARLGSVPGGRPYREFGGVPFKPRTDEELCVRCGACVVQCPVCAIDAEDPTKTDADACISCMRCIDVCPRGAREIGGGLTLGAARKAFAVKCAKRQKSYLL